jgi:hypothetical protein
VQIETAGQLQTLLDDLESFLGSGDLQSARDVLGHIFDVASECVKVRRRTIAGGAAVHQEGSYPCDCRCSVIKQKFTHVT